MELVVLSGKGGTGKTTIATSICELAKSVVRVDCDVDAPNFYMFYDGEDIKHDIFSGKKIEIDSSKCIKCNKCINVCKFNAINNFTVDKLSCESCGACKLVCPVDAIKFYDEKIADTFLTKLEDGIISRADMAIGADGSGKLINKIRRNASDNNEENRLIVSDGSPGIGCSVISSITGCDAALIVTEPTKSGLNDLKRVLSLCEHFDVYTMVCINKYDINNNMTEKIEKFVNEKDIKIVGKIPYDDTVMKSINELQPIIKYKNSSAASAIESMWNNIKKYINI